MLPKFSVAVKVTEDVDSADKNRLSCRDHPRKSTVSELVGFPRYARDFKKERRRIFRVSLRYVVGGCLCKSLSSSGAKSGLLHLLACGVRCGMDALHFELEVVWIAGVL